MPSHTTDMTAVLIRVRGLVQGVGFRPLVWQLARQHDIRGHVLNDGLGVRIYAIGPAARIEDFLETIQEQAPVLARIDEIISEPADYREVPDDFRIVKSEPGKVDTGVAPDSAACEACVQEVLDPFARRYRYPFATCTHCGPRLTIQETLPYDRSGTTMRGFVMCGRCRSEYEDPSDRRFHAQPIACQACGPTAVLERSDGQPIDSAVLSGRDAVDVACTLLQRGSIVAIKGLGGFQLACDATHEAAVARLRRMKRREGKPFALMARDLEVIRRYCVVNESELTLLCSPAAPIVILPARAEGALAPCVAPGLRTLGFMLPNTPLHHLLLRRMDRPIVLTSGNRADEPQWIDDGSARVNLGGIAEYFLLHDRPIAQRADDSVAKVMGGIPRVFRRSRGYAPAPLRLPREFEQAPQVLALGGELKNTFCLVRDGQALLSHHIGDLKDALTSADFTRALDHYTALFDHRPELVAIDRHPDYRSAKIGRELARQRALPVCDVQHHHAHIAACLAENGIPLDHPPVLGIALDGLGYGGDGQWWGGEFLVADYRTAARAGTFKPVPMPGGERAVNEPWRNTYAHLTAELGWARFARDYQELDLYRFLAAKPRQVLDQMLLRRVNSPPASSCGRLFDAVAAAVGLCREQASYEGQAAVELEQAVDRPTLESEDRRSYRFVISFLNGTALPYIDPLPMWQALLGDLVLRTPISIIAARFHKGLARAICAMADKLTHMEGGSRPIRQVALSGGVFQNHILFELVTMELAEMGFTVLTHRQIPPNDGGLALGQAAVAAARALSHGA